jgi:cytochrome oxidase Cu insertion factor (SCO1/SenC/PrrC family)
MRCGRKVYRALCMLLVAGMAVVLGASAASAAAEFVTPPMGLGEVKPATPMPTFNLPSVHGKTFDSSTLRGKVVVVRFWATW